MLMTIKTSTYSADDFDYELARRRRKPVEFKKKCLINRI